MKTRKLWLLFLGVKGALFLAPLSFVLLHYMITGAGQGSATLNAFDNGLTKLMWAAQRNDVSAAQKLVADGADLDIQSMNIAPNYKNPDGSPKISGDTALHMACANLDNPVAEQIVRLLVRAGADVRIKNRALGETALHSAAFNLSTLDNRLLPIIELLVKNGADINATNNDGDTLMHYAIDKMRRDWLEALLSGQFGALVDRSVKNNKGMTAEAEAANSDMRDFFKKPQPTYLITERDPNGLTGLMIAVIRGNDALVRTAPTGAVVLNERTVEKGPDVYGYTALHLALLHQRVQTLKALMERGADPNVKDARGNVPLHFIYKLDSSSDRVDAIKALVNDDQKASFARHADLNVQDAKGNTLLHLAVMRGDEQLVRFLLDTYGKKLNLSLTNAQGNTPGQLARARGATALQTMLGA